MRQKALLGDFYLGSHWNNLRRRYLCSHRTPFFFLGTLVMERLPLFAIGPQNIHSTTSLWDPLFKQHTRFELSHVSVPFIGSEFIGNTVTVELKPNTLGDLVSNMYLHCSLPPGISYANNVGRSLIKKVDFMINEQIVESLTDDWYQIRDEMFLDSDEKVNINGVTSDPNEMYIPFDFFFCRRFSHDKTRPSHFFPMCALVSQKIYIRITFNQSTWFSNSNSVELLNPEIIIEQIQLTDEERIYFRTRKIDMVIPRIKQESVTPFSTGSLIVPLTASFPVQSVFWFFRRKSYETDVTEYTNRYTYGYKDNSRYGLPLPGTGTNFNDAIKQATLYLNNINILGTFQGGLYYRFKQPMTRGFTVPVKDIYTYSFGLDSGQGTADFSKLDSAKTTLNIDFEERYSTQIALNFNMYIYYYGWTLLTFQGGSGSLSYVG